MMVREMRRRGKEAYGIELSPSVLEKDAPDMLKAGWVEQGTLTNLPYAGEHRKICISVCRPLHGWQSAG